jgi:two-component system chemotaxis response regulator CheB
LRQLNTLIAAASVELRVRVREALEATLHAETPKIAASGRLALQMLEHGSIDVIVAESNLPDMTDNELLDELDMRGFKTHVIVLSHTPMANARSAISRLKEGRLHFLESPGITGKSSDDEFKRFILQVRRVLEKITLLRRVNGPQERIPTPEMPRPASPVVYPATRVNLDSFRPKVICVGCSTGGPAALEVVFSRLKGKSAVPILIVQHMPPGFTASLAARIQLVSGLKSAEGRPGEPIKPGHVYVAPGDYHMRLAQNSGDVAIHLDHGPKRNSVRPSVDFIFETAAHIYGRNTLGFVLTGMGEDGLAGTQAIKKGGGAVIIQDKESSVVWGMPGAVHSAGSFDAMVDLERCADLLALMSSGR